MADPSQSPALAPAQPPAWADAPIVHSSFYRFCDLSQPAAVADWLRELGTLYPELTGSLIVASEGLNGALAAPQATLDNVEAALNAAPWWPMQPEGRGSTPPRNLRFKRSPCEKSPFFRFKVRVKPQIVALELPTDTVPVPQDGVTPLPGQVTPEQWRELLDRPDVVVLDNRNHFEWRLGHFRGAADPQVNHFRDFTEWLTQQAPDWRAQGKTVAMYCTGGIRCERTGPWMRSLGLNVVELEGGILNYFQQMPEAERDWDGLCAVFDRRLAIDTRLAPADLQPEDVYDPKRPDEAWRLTRAHRLDTPES